MGVVAAYRLQTKQLERKYVAKNDQTYSYTDLITS